jgi:hypothetical protein
MRTFVLVGLLLGGVSCNRGNKDDRIAATGAERWSDAGKSWQVQSTYFQMVAGNLLQYTIDLPIDDPTVFDSVTDEKPYAVALPLMQYAYKRHLYERGEHKASLMGVRLLHKNRDYVVSRSVEVIAEALQPSPPAPPALVDDRGAPDLDESRALGDALARAVVNGDRHAIYEKLDKRTRSKESEADFGKTLDMMESFDGKIKSFEFKSTSELTRVSPWGVYATRELEYAVETTKHKKGERVLDIGVIREPSGLAVEKFSMGRYIFKDVPRSLK